MSYHVLARKWRPQTFADMVGQAHVVKALTYALTQKQVHHAYLFTGTRGVGKTSIARIFAKSLNCETNGVSPTPCGQCESCQEIRDGKFIDLIEVDAASRTGVDETRELIDSVAYLPNKGRYKVYLIDEVHMFSKSSFNALLKTLEEPPAHVKFILATTDPEKLPITILSRCLQFNLKSLSKAQIKQHLANICQAESIRYEDKALALLADAGDGSMRDTLSMTDQAIAYGQGELHLTAVSEILGTIHPADIESLLFAVATNNPAQLYNAFQRLDDYEVDARAFLIEVMRRLQHMAWAKEGIANDLSPTLLSTVTDIPKALLHLWYDIAEKALPGLAIAGDARAAVEMTMLRMLAFIPPDWLPRQRTPIEVAADDAPPATTTAGQQPEAEEATTTPPLEPVSDDSLDDSPPWQEHDAEATPSAAPPPPLQATQVQATAVASADDLAAAEQSFVAASDTQTDDPTGEEPAGIESTEDPSDAWYLNQEPPSNDPPVDMAQVEAVMQRGSDLTPQSPAGKAEPLKADENADNTTPNGTAEDKTAQSTGVDGNNLGNDGIENFDWLTVIEHLQLSDYTHHCVAQGIVRLQTTERAIVATLDLPPLNEVLASKESCQELQDALQNYLASPIELTVNFTELTQQTPAQAEQQRTSQQQSDLRLSFYDHPITQRLVSELGGEVIDKTIKAIPQQKN